MFDGSLHFVDEELKRHLVLIALNVTRKYLTYSVLPHKRLKNTYRVKRNEKLLTLASKY